MGEREPNRGINVARGDPQEFKHVWPDNRLFIDHAFDIGEGSVRVRGCSVFCGDPIAGDNEADQGLAAEVHTNARAWFDERFVARENAIIKESVERHRQSYAHHSLVRGIVRIGRLLAVEKGGRHGESVWRARARGKATRSGRR